MRRRGSGLSPFVHAMSMSADAPSEKGQCADQVHAMAELMRRAELIAVHTRWALGPHQPPLKGQVERWHPLLAGIASRARHRRIEMSGIDALRSFAQLWDERLRQMTAREARPALSLAQVRTMATLLAEYEAWLLTHFPGASSDAGRSSS